MKVTLGDNLEELSRKWEYSLKKRYFPEIESLGLPKMESTQLTDGGYAVKGVPIRWNSGDGEKDWIVYKANRLGYTGIYMMPLNGKGKKPRTVIKGERSTQFESMHLLRSGIDANDQGLLVFSSKSREHDVLYIYDLNKSEVVHRFDFDDLVAVRSPRLSVDASQVVFYGVTKSGIADIYLIDISSSDVSKLTDDIYYDIAPTFSLNGDSIYFVSDRSKHGQAGASNIYSLDLDTRDISQVTFGPFIDQTPEATERGLFFASNRDGPFNLFLLDDDGGLTRQSTYLTGSFHPRLTPDGDWLVYTGYQDMGFQIYSMELPEEPEPVRHPLASKGSPWYPELIERKYSRASIKYDADYSLDIAQSTIAYDPSYGSVGGIQAAVSDMLGNRAYYFLLANTADTRSEFLSSFNVGVTYVNKEKRLNWGIGIYHLYDEYFNDFDQYFDERQAGALTFFSYPVSRFNRFDFSSFMRYSKKDRRFGLEDREGFLVTHYLSWINDNSLWEISGPIEGHRYNLTVGLTYSVSEVRNWNRVAFADIRHYHRLGRYSAFANRLFAYTSSDIGSAWDDEFDQFLGSFGTGFRVNVGGVVLLRFDFTRTTDFEKISPRTDFDFFFGWNF
jgi:Tol biopolymer transport system component